MPSQDLLNTIAIIGFILTVIAFIIGIIGTYYGFISFKKKKPTYYIQNFTLISDSLKRYTTESSDLQIQYKGNNIERLSVSRVVFLNLGNDVIHRQDIASGDPLRISLIGTKIFKQQVIYSRNEPANQFKTNLQNDEIIITFDYLGKNEGGIIEFVHTGNTSDIKFQGIIQNHQLNSLNDYKDTSFILSFFSDWLSLILMIILTLLLTLSSFFSSSSPLLILLSSFFSSLSPLLLFLLFLLFFILFLLPYLVGIFFQKIKYMYKIPKEYTSILEQPWKI